MKHAGCFLHWAAGCVREGIWTGSRGSSRAQRLSPFVAASAAASGPKRKLSGKLWGRVPAAAVTCIRSQLRNKSHPTALQNMQR